MNSKGEAQLESVKRLMNANRGGEISGEAETNILKAQESLVELTNNAVESIAPELMGDTAMYDRNGRQIEGTGVSEDLCGLYILKKLQDCLQDEIRKQIAVCLNAKTKRFVISEVLGVSSPNLYRAFDYTEQEPNAEEEDVSTRMKQSYKTIEEYRNELKESDKNKS